MSAPPKVPSPRITPTAADAPVPSGRGRWARMGAAIALLVAGATGAGSAAAAQYCVGNVTELRNAIAAVTGATGAGSNDIRIQTGTYNVATGASGAFALSLTLNTTPLTISGGWNAGCSQRNLIADATILSGNDSVRVMSVIALSNSNAELTMDGLSFRDGRTTSGNAPSCLRIETDGSSDVDIFIDRTTYFDCRATGAALGPAIEIISRSGDIRVRSSVVTDSAGPLGAVLLTSLGGNIQFNSNTVAFNDDVGAAGGPAGVQTTRIGNGVLWLASNILWGNGVAGSSDLFVGLDDVVFINANVIGVIAGDLEDLVQQNTLNGNPGFISPTDLRLTASSIARNTGSASAVGGYTSQDSFGDARVQGGRIDRGAREFGELFANGFE